MEFGHVAPEELNIINFELPPDPPQTIRTLQESKSTADFDLRIGATKWGRKEWLTPTSGFTRLFRNPSAI